MPNFTNGTWRITDRLGHEHRAIMIGSGDNGHVICKVSQHNQNRESDASLICAAPDLYHALENLRGYSDTFHPADWYAAEAALSKAIGETQ